MHPLPRNQSPCLPSEIPTLGLEVRPGVRNTCWLIQSQLLTGYIWPNNLEVSEYTELRVNCQLILVWKAAPGKRNMVGKEFAKCKMHYFQAASTTIIHLALFVQAASKLHHFPSQCCREYNPNVIQKLKLGYGKIRDLEADNCSWQYMWLGEVETLKENETQLN